MASLQHSAMLLMFSWLFWQTLARPGNQLPKPPKNRFASAQALRQDLMTTGGAVADFVEIFLRENVGLGLKASRDVEDGDILLAVPYHLQMSSQKLDRKLKQRLRDLKDEREEENRQTDGKHQPFVVLSLQLLLEYRRGRKSKWYKWIDIMLPTGVQPMHYTDYQREILNGTSMSGMLVTFQAWLSEMKSFAQLDSAQRKPLFDPPLNFDELSWAWNSVTTRAETHGAALVLLPLIDLANHAAAADCNTIMTTQTVDGTMYKVFVSVRPVAAGEEIVYSYGPWDNIKLLVNYGFSLANNTFGPPIFERAITPQVTELYAPCSLEGYFNYSYPVPPSHTSNRVLHATEPLAISDVRLICEVVQRTIEKGKGSFTNASVATVAAVGLGGMHHVVTCTDRAGKVCKVVIGTESITFRKHFLQGWVREALSVVEYYQAKCQSEVDRAETRKKLSSWKALQMNSNPWSTQLLAAVQSEEFIFRRCAYGLSKRKGDLLELKTKLRHHDKRREL